MSTLYNELLKVQLEKEYGEELEKLKVELLNIVNESIKLAEENALDDLKNGFLKDTERYSTQLKELDKIKEKIKYDLLSLDYSEMPFDIGGIKRTVIGTIKEFLKKC